MPYPTLKALPEPVKHVLPTGAQKIYREAFNHAWEEYKDPKKRRSKTESQEETAHKVAWAAVKKKYVKKGENWTEK